MRGPEHQLAQVGAGESLAHVRPPDLLQTDVGIQLGFGPALGQLLEDVHPPGGSGKVHEKVVGESARPEDGWINHVNPAGKIRKKKYQDYR